MAGGSVHVANDIKTPVPVVIGTNNAAGDAFGRLRVSNPETLFDSKNIFNDGDIADTLENLPLFYDNQEVSGSGTSTSYDNDKAHQTLSVSESTAGKRVRQTKQRFNYQPGKSMLVFMTFTFASQQHGIIQSEGIYDDKNGIFFHDDGNDYSVVTRSYTTGSAVDTKVKQSDWNIDRMDGTGKSGIELDFTKTQIFITDYEWLGVGRVRVGWVIDGVVYYCHQFLNTNNLSVVYMSTPNLPLRSEIENTGTGGAATMTQICSTVISEGAQNPLGTNRYASTNGTHTTATTENTLYAVLGIRLKRAYIGETIDIQNVSVQLQTASEQVEWVLLFNPTVASTFTYVDEPQSAVQIARGATANTVTDGYKVAGSFLESGGNATGASGSIVKSIKSALKLGSNIDGSVDTFVLCVRPIGGSSGVQVEGSIEWQELT